MYVTVVLLAAGKGVRIKSRIPKPIIQINSRPLIFYCLDTLSRNPDIKDIIVVANQNNKKFIRTVIEKYRIAKVKDLVLGGLRRQDSVYNGLRVIDERTDLVLIHDAARPFIGKRDLSLVIKKAKRCGAVVLGVPLKATIKKVRNQKSKIKNCFVVKQTLTRDALWEIQTPQVFKKEIIQDAYRKFRRHAVTDDAMLVEKMGVKVCVIPGSYTNIKITTPEDLVFAQAIARENIS